MKKYLLIISIILCCSLSINAQCPFTINSNLTNVTCPPGNDGAIYGYALGGIAPYMYWLNNGTPQAIGNYGNLGAGIYTLHVQDSTLCHDSAIVTIYAPYPLSIDSISTTDAYCNNGSICMVASGGTAAYMYTITPGNIANMTGCFNNLAPGMYTVSVIDGNYCIDDSAVIVVGVPYSMNLTATPNNALCNCAGSVTLNATGGFTPYTYSIVGGINPNAVNICDGFYTAMVTDSIGCQTSDNFTIASTQAPIYISTALVNANCAICNGSITMSATGGGGGPYTYDLYNGAVLLQSNLIGIFNSLCGSLYTITATDITGCTKSSVSYIQTISPITLSTNATNASCGAVANGTITVNPAGGTIPYQYSKDGGLNYQAANIFTGLNNASYNVQVLDAAGCTKTAVVIVGLNTPITIMQISNTPDTCYQNKGSLSVLANGAIGTPVYSLAGFPNNNNGIFQFLPGQTHYVSVTDSIGCTEFAGFGIANTTTALPTVTIIDTIMNVSCAGMHDGSIQLTLSGGNPPFMYNWGGAFNNFPFINNKDTGIHDVLIKDNVGDCQLYSFQINLNGANCGAISGKAYLDTNADCVFNAGEMPIKNSFIHLSNGMLGYTNMNGDYAINNIPFSTLNMTQTPPNYIFENSCTQPMSFTLNAANPTINNLDFADSSYAQCDAQAWISSGTASPGFYGAYTFSIINNSPANSCLNNAWFIKPANINFGNILPAPASINQDTAFWNTIGVGGYASTNLTVGFFVPAAVPLGTLLNACAHVDVIGTDINLLNNDYCFQSITSGAYDPNNKSVSPVGEGPAGNILLQDSILNYRINFQNTGTDSAVNVYIMDTLSDKLDLAALKIMASSHPYMIEILNSNILKFKFDNIMLPDSNVNEPLSHGYIAYSIEQKNSNQIGDVINNTASIYFDFNAPIVTNTTINTIAVPALLSSPEFEKYIHVYPNPATDKINVEFTGNSNVQSSITLTNTLGQVVKTVLAKTINGKNNIELSVKELPKGVYLLKLVQGKNQSMKKVVIE